MKTNGTTVHCCMHRYLIPRYFCRPANFFLVHVAWKKRATIGTKSYRPSRNGTANCISRRPRRRSGSHANCCSRCAERGRITCGSVCTLNASLLLYPLPPCFYFFSLSKSSAIVIRGLATEEIHQGNRWRVIWREARAGVASACVLSVASFVRVLLTPGATTVATLAVSVAMGQSVGQG